MGQKEIYSSLESNHENWDLQIGVLTVAPRMRWKYGKNIGGLSCLCVKSRMDMELLL
jgi:hypothetical protein